MIIMFLLFSGQVACEDDFTQYILKEPHDKGYYCSFCEQFRRRAVGDVRNHVESKHFPNTFSYPCSDCGDVMGTRKALERHRQRIHSDNPNQ